MIPFGEYKPDVSDYMGQHTVGLSNVLPRGDGYGPFPGFNILSAALSAANRGFFFARQSDGTIRVFAGISNKLYLMSNTDFTWSDVSKALGTYTALASGDQWQFAQFGNNVIAVQVNTVPQVYTLGSSTEFADLGGSPGASKYIGIVNRFVVLSGTSADAYAIKWSALGSSTGWTAGTNQSDSQSFPDGGLVRGVAGGEYGVIVQEGAIRRMVYSRGSPTIFDIDQVSDDIGIQGPYSLTRGGNKVFFYSNKGFMMVGPSGAPVPIGKERVDRTFAAQLDTSALQLFIGAADPKATRAYWAYRGAGSSAALFDKIISYDWALDRWAPPVSITGQYLATLAAPGLTLENLDTINASIDALTFSLDDVSTAAQANLAGANDANKLGFYNGSNLEATLETPEQGIEGRRIFVRGFRPVSDAGTIQGRIKHRAQQGSTATETAENAMDSRGFVPARIDTRYAKAKIRIPASTTWTFATGVEPDFVPTGQR